MGYDPSATLIIGFKIKKEDLVDEIVRVIPGCTHSFDRTQMKFCPECGRKAFDELKSYQFKNKYLRKFCPEEEDSYDDAYYRFSDEYENESEFKAIGIDRYNNPSDYYFGIEVLSYYGYGNEDTCDLEYMTKCLQNEPLQEIASEISKIVEILLIDTGSS